jgi:Peptidase_C39 like family
MRKTLQFFVIILTVTAIWAGILFLLSSESLNWRVQTFVAQIKYAISPPEKVVFIPASQPTIPPVDPTFVLPSPTPTISLSTPTATATPEPTATPTLVPTTLPAEASLTGVLHQYQMWNNCGPANLAMALSFWGWKGDQRDTAAFLKPNPLDKNVMPYEMEAFVEQETNLGAVVRVGGEMSTIKALISSGFPVIVEKGFEGVGFDGWMGHYQVVTGYDDSSGKFIVQDSYKGPDYPVPYDSFLSDWRAFNYTYLVIYPPDQRQSVLDILSLQVYDNFNTDYALQKSEQDVKLLQGRDLFFALFNQGTNQVAKLDYSQAALSYDAAFANYAVLPEKTRPWRLMWYQTGPYFAYYYVGRYQDVINLATQTLDSMSDPLLEESFYWRARAYLALADQESAEKDLRSCLKVHPGFDPCNQELLKMGIVPPPTPSS